MPENKADLAAFLSIQLSTATYGDIDVVVAGGFVEEDKALSTAGSDVSTLSATHEEADTRIIVHASQSNQKTVVVCARDTDVILLLLHHYQRIKCDEVWVMAGTSGKRKFIPIHTIALSMDDQLRRNILAFHAITGCDVTSYLAGISKKNAWKTYMESSHLLSTLGNIPLSENAVANVEKFVVKLYKTNDNIKTCDAARYVLFGKTKKTDSLPPCSDTIRQHIKRAHYQTVIWEKAYLTHIDAPTPASSGWSVDEEGVLVPVWSTIGPVPQSCLEFVYCKSCKVDKCSTKRCCCRSANLPCTLMCNCIDCNNA